MFYEIQSAPIYILQLQLMVCQIGFTTQRRLMQTKHNYDYIICILIIANQQPFKVCQGFSLLAEILIVSLEHVFCKSGLMHLQDLRNILYLRGKAEGSSLWATCLQDWHRFDYPNRTQHIKQHLLHHNSNWRLRAG